MSTSPPGTRPIRHRPLTFLLAAYIVAVALAAGLAPRAGADTAPTLAAITPNTVRAVSCPVAGEGCAGMTLALAGDGFGATSTVEWRGVDYPVSWSGDSTSVTAAIPGLALEISEAFLTVDVTLTTGGATSNPRSVTIVGPAVTEAQSATVGAGATATVATSRLSATYTRAGAGYGTVTAATYAYPVDPVYPTDPISPIAYVDLQLRSSSVGDSLVGTFVPPNPVYPTDPVVPPNPILPPNPIRLAYWTGSAWSPVFGSGGAVPSFSFDYATTTASPATVRFSETSTPQLGALGGTVFAMVAAYAFVGFEDPVDNATVNQAKAGRAIPLKWRVLDLGGNPVTDLTAADVKLSSIRVDCGGLPGEGDPLEAYAPGASALQNLGDGYYQWNWKTEIGWKGTCRRLQLDLGDDHANGSPLYRTTDFVFTR